MWQKVHFFYRSVTIWSHLQNFLPFWNFFWDLHSHVPALFYALSTCTSIHRLHSQIALLRSNSTFLPKVLIQIDRHHVCDDISTGTLISSTTSTPPALQSALCLDLIPFHLPKSWFKLTDIVPVMISQQTEQRDISIWSLPVQRASTPPALTNFSYLSYSSLTKNLIQIDRLWSAYSRAAMLANWAGLQIALLRSNTPLVPKIWFQLMMAWLPSVGNQTWRTNPAKNIHVFPEATATGSNCILISLKRKTTPQTRKIRHCAQ